MKVNSNFKKQLSRLSLIVVLVICFGIISMAQSYTNIESGTYMNIKGQTYLHVGKFTSKAGAGLKAEGTTGKFVTFTGNGSNSQLELDGNAKLNFCEIKNMEAHDAVIVKSSNVTIENSKIQSNKTGIKINVNGTSEITGNIIAQNSVTGIWIDGTNTNADLTNNTIVDNSQGQIKISSGNSSAMTFTNNIIGNRSWKQTGGSIIDGGDAVLTLINCNILDNAATSTASVTFTDCIDSVPFFAAESYALTEYSPCIDAGKEDGALPEKDLLGNDRKTRTVDIGALEFSGTRSYVNFTATKSLDFTYNFVANVPDGITQYSWSFGDGATATGKTPSHTFRESGLFKVTLTVVDEQGNKIYVTKKVNIGELCMFDVSYDVGEKTEAGYPVTFTSVGTYTNWMWDFGNQNFASTANNASHIYTNDGVYDVKVVAIKDGNTTCRANTQVELGVFCHSTFTFNQNTTNNNVTLIAIPQGNVTSFQWSIAGQIYTNDTINIEAMKPGYHEINLTVKNNTGCAYKLTDEILVWSEGLVTCKTEFTARPDENDPLKYMFTNESSDNLDNYFWQFGDNISNAATETVEFTFDKAGIYTVSLLGEDTDFGCTDKKEKQIIVGNYQALTSDFNFMINHEELNVELWQNALGQADSFVWQLNDGTYKFGDTASHKFTKPGQYEICLTAINTDNNDFAQKCNLISVGDGVCFLEADFSHSIDAATDIRTATFTPISNGEPIEWYWDFCDNTASVEDTITHTYTEEGIYHVKLNIVDAQGCKASVTKRIVIGEVQCEADFDYSVNPEDLTVSVKNKSTGINISSYYWWYDDGDISFDANPADKIYDEVGIYNVKLTIYDKDNNCSATRQKDIKVGNVPCVAQIHYLVDSANNTVKFESHSIYSDDIEYNWILSDGTQYTTQTVEHQFAEAGLYKAVLNINSYFYEGNDTLVCTDKQINYIPVGNTGAICNAKFTAVEVADKTISLQNKSKGTNMSYFWYFDGGEKIVTERYPEEQTFATAGYHEVCLYVNKPAPDGCEDLYCEKVPVSLTDGSDCKAQFVYNINLTQKKVAFIDKSLGSPNTYTWRFGDGSESSSKNPVHFYNDAKFYGVELIVENETTGCQSYHFDILNLSDSTGLKGAFTYKVNKDNKKAGGHPTDFVGVAFGQPTRTAWDFGDDDASENTFNPSHNYAKVGDYNVCFSVANSNLNQEQKVCKTITIDTTTTGVNTLDFSTELKVYPNPTSDKAYIVYVTKQQIDMEISMFDMTGRKIKQVVSPQTHVAGKYIKQINTQHLAGGEYFIKMKSGNVEKTLKLMIVK